MIPNKFSMVDFDGIDIVESQGLEIPGIYDRLVESIIQCRYQVIYNWKFDGILVPPSYVEMRLVNNEVKINSYISVTNDDVLHIHSLEIPAILRELSVSSNGTYIPPEGVDGYDSVIVDVQPPLEEITITENGEYLPSYGYYGIGKAIVSTQEGIPLLSRQDWNDLTMLQKQAYGLVAIQDTDTGFLRGELVNGADYITLLPNSVSANILAEGLCESYLAGKSVLGGLTLIGNPVVQSDGSLQMSGSAVYASCPNIEDVSMTVYGVLKVSSGSFAGRLLSICKSASTSREQLMCLNGNSTASVIWASYGSDSSVSCNVTQKHVYAISADVSTGKSRFYLDGVYLGEKSFVALGYPYWSSNASSQYTNADFYYGAVVSGMEADATIIANMQTIMTHYEIT